MSSNVSEFRRKATPKRLPTTVIHLARLQVFQPTRTPAACTRTVNTPWGCAEIQGRLGVMHAAFMEAVLFHAKAWRRVDDKIQQVRVDPYDLRRTLGAQGARGGYSSTALHALARDLSQCTVSLHTKNWGPLVLPGFISDIDTRHAVAKSASAITGGPRHLWCVTLSPEATSLVNGDLALHYDPRPLSALRSGVAMAVARWCLTHRESPQGGWKMATVLEAVGSESTGAAGRKRRHEIQKDGAALAVSFRQRCVKRSTDARID